MSNRIHVATRKGLFSYERNGGGWRIARTAFLGAEAPMFLQDPRDGSLYAAIGHGHFGAKLHRSTDAGKTWTEITAPAYPEKPDDAPPFHDDFRGIDIPWRVEMIWALAIDPRNDGALWCGTLPGGLFHSPDHGQTWTLNRTLWDHGANAKWTGGGYDYPGIHSILVDPRDANDVIVGVSTGGVWRTTDGGASWRVCSHGMRAEYMPPEQAYDPNVQDAHIVVRCPKQPDVMWSQHHNGIFRTTDNAAKWVEIKNVKPSVFGFAAAVHPDDGDTAWFVPGVKDECRIPVDGKVVVTRTRDGGASFDILSDGLPQQNAYDIVFRHALDIDDDGRCLAMGSTTGSLWVSDDQGEHWMELSAHLPPIYVVRFEHGA